MSPLRKVHLLSGSAYEVRGCHDLRDFKQALSKELGHPAYLLTLLSDGVAITCNDEWQRLDSSKHLVAVQSCPFTDFVTDFDQDLIEVLGKTRSTRLGRLGFCVAARCRVAAAALP